MGTLAIKYDSNSDLEIEFGILVLEKEASTVCVFSANLNHLHTVQKPRPHHSLSRTLLCLILIVIWGNLEANVSQNALVLFQ